MRNPHRRGGQLSYPGVPPGTNLFELFSRDTMIGLQRRVAHCEAVPNDRAYALRDAEMRRVLKLHPGVPMPPAVAARLAQKRPPARGRRSKSALGAFADRAALQAARRRYNRLLTFYERLQRAGRFDRLCADLGARDSINTPALLAAEMMRRIYYPRTSHPRSLLNRFSKMPLIDFL